MNKRTSRREREREGRHVIIAMYFIWLSILTIAIVPMTLYTPSLEMQLVVQKLLIINK